MENVFNQSIWGDEGFSAILSMHSLQDIFKIIANDTSPPLWNIFEWLVFNTIGTNEVYIRSLSLAFYLGALFFTYKIASLYWSKKTGILATLLIALNPFFFTYAFEGRMYSIMALGVAASMYFFAKSFFGEGGKWTRRGYIFFTLWALYSHHFAIFALFIQGLWWLYEFIFGRRKTAKNIFKSWLVIGIGYLPWVWPLYNQTKKVGGGFWLSTPTTNDLRNMLYEYLAQGIKFNDLVLPYTNITLHETALYLVFTILILKKWNSGIKKNIFLILWFVGPIVLTWLVSQRFQSIFFNRYLLYTIPAAMLLIASGRRKYSIIPVAFLLITFSFIDYTYFTRPAKLPFKQLSHYVSQTRKEGDFFINWNSSSHHLWETKYYGFNSPIFIPGGGELPYFVGTALMKDDDVISEIPEYTKRVGVTTSGNVDDIELPPEYTETERFDMNGLKFIWYEKE